MNPFTAVSSFFKTIFLTGQRAAQEREQQGPQGRSYSDDLNAQFQAYYKEHGTAEGFQYKEPSE